MLTKDLHFINLINLSSLIVFYDPNQNKRKFDQKIATNNVGRSHQFSSF